MDKAKKRVTHLQVQKIIILRWQTLRTTWGILKAALFGQQPLKHVENNGYLRNHNCRLHTKFFEKGYLFVGKNGTQKSLGFTETRSFPVQ